MYLLPINRRELLDVLPKGGVVAEIGVATGDFSKEIATRSQPGALHLIDPWVHWEREDYLGDPENVAQGEHDGRYDAVCSMFSDGIAAGSVFVHRDYSVPAAARFPDASFDWVFLDGMHTFDAVLEDLRAWAPKIKPGALLMGHDYANHPYAKEMGFGVVEAVDRFVAETEWEIVFLTLENFPTYVLAQKPFGPEVEALITSVLHHVPTVVEIADPAAMGYRQKTLRFSDGSLKTGFSFGLNSDAG